jgi:hypothetical protein
MELEQRRAEQEKLNAQLKEREELSQAAEEKYASIQEECLAKTKKLKKLWNRSVTRVFACVRASGFVCDGV